MGLEEDLRVLGEQERKLTFARFSAEDAWRLGSSLREMAKGDARPVAIGIWLAGQMLFYAATEGVVPSNEDWLRRKRNTVLRFGKSSLRMGVELEKAGTTLEARQGLTLADYATHGGGVPIVLRGTGCVGAVVVSGLTQREDHTMAVEAMAEMLGVRVEGLEVRG